jgi:hypothetical protein
MTENTSYRSNNVWSKARCLDRNPDDWFPEMGDRNGSQIRPVRQICASCPLRAKCLRIAISIHVESATTLTGIWGGLRAEEIRQAISQGHDIRQMLRTARVLAVKLPGKPGKTREKETAPTGPAATSTCSGACPPSPAPASGRSAPPTTARRS